MGKIGKGLVNNQKKTRENRGFVNPDKVLDIKAIKGVDWHSFKADEIHKVNIIPWQIKSKNDFATKMKGDFKKNVGDWVYSLNYWCHPRVHGEKDEICLKKNFGKPCAICDEADKKWKIYNEKQTDENKAAANNLTSKLRSMYNLEVLSADLKGKNSFFEASDFIFENPLIEKATECEDGEEPVSFYETDTEEGRIIKFKRPKKAQDKYINFEFRERKNPIKSSLLEGIVRFGELIQVPTSEEVAAFFYGAGYIPEDDELEEREEEDEEEEELDESSDTSEETEEEEESEEPDEQEEAEEEEEKPKKPKCPAKLKFGVDYGTDDACDECSVDMECFKANKKLKK